MSPFNYDLENDPNKKRGSQHDTPSFRDRLNVYLYHWPIFVVGVLIAVAIAYIQLQLNPTPYQVKASLMIQDDKKGPDEKTQLQELDPNSPSKLVENEIEVLKSRNLISQMVNDLQLWVSYKEKVGFKNVDLYTSSPVKFRPLGVYTDRKAHTFTIKIKDNKSFFLKKSNGKLQEIHFNDTLENSFGYWKLLPVSNIASFKNVEITIDLADQEQVSKNYQKAIDAVLTDKLAPVIELSITDVSEQRGKDILNHLITIYNEANTEDKNKANQSTLDFIDKRLVTLAGELSNSEAQVENFRSSKGVTEISSQSKVYLQDAQANDQKLNEVDIKLDEINGIEKYIASPNNTQTTPVTLDIQDPTLNDLIQTLSKLQLDREKLLGTTPEGNPAFVPINMQIRTVKTSISERIQNMKTSLIATRNRLVSLNSKYETSIKDIPVTERQLVDKTREQDVKRDLYVYLRQKREEIALNYASTLKDARVVDNAYADQVSGRKALAYGIALLIGLIVPASYVYGKNFLRNRIVDSTDITNATGAPILGELNQVKARSQILMLNNNDTSVSEQFRSLRTNLHYVHGTKGSGRVTMFTSSVSGEGKSFISTNLAISLALAGRKTIIVEFDLRRPKLADIFSLPKSNHGVSEYLQGKASKDVIIQNLEASPNLYVITSGSIPANPSELLETERLAELISYLRANYDDILLDTPPLHLVTDALILSQLADVSLYLIRQGFTSKAELKFIKGLYDQDRLKKMNIIFNSIQRNKYGYGYKYDNSYYKQAASIAE